jgi:hypothetical protein
VRSASVLIVSTMLDLRLSLTSDARSKISEGLTLPCGSPMRLGRASRVAVRRIPPPIPSPARGRLPPPQHMMHPSPRGPPPSGGPHHHHYMMMGPPMGPMGFSPMGMQMTPAGYSNQPHMPQGEHHPHGMYPPPPGHPGMSRAQQPSRPQKKVAPKVTPRTPGVRVQFDPASSRKKRKLSSGAQEPTLPYFGENLPEQPKTTALAIFSFLSNDDLYNAGLVCKKWTQLSMDEELWKFQS